MNLTGDSHPCGLNPLTLVVQMLQTHLIQDLGNFFVGEGIVRNFRVNTEATKAEMTTMEDSRSKRKAEDPDSEKR